MQGGCGVIQRRGERKTVKRERERENREKEKKGVRERRKDMRNSLLCSVLSESDNSAACVRGPVRGV